MTHVSGIAHNFDLVSCYDSTLTSTACKVVIIVKICLVLCPPPLSKCICCLQSAVIEDTAVESSSDAQDYKEDG